MPLDKFKCWYCGKELEYDSEPQTRVYCADCYAKAQEEQRQLLKEHIERRIRVMYGHALTKMERAGVYMHEYAEIAPRLLERALKAPERFLSSYEMISAMVLESNGYEFEVNKRIGKHMVDFYVPEMKVIYEVDGDRHEFSALEDGRRDMALREQLGADWEIVRIPTQYIEQNPEMIPEALEQMRAYKRKMRKDYCGHLPDGFSKREKALYDKIRQHNTKRVWK